MGLILKIYDLNLDRSTRPLRRANAELSEPYYRSVDNSHLAKSVGYDECENTAWKDVKIDIRKQIEITPN